jgi:hypothetical protein
VQLLQTTVKCRNAFTRLLLLLLLLLLRAVNISSLSKDIVLLIKEDHDRVRSLYDQVRSCQSMHCMNACIVGCRIVNTPNIGTICAWLVSRFMLPGPIICCRLRLQYKMPGTNASQKRLLAWNIIREVSLHSCKEEEVRQQACGQKSVQQLIIGAMLLMWSIECANCTSVLAVYRQ